ncbi:hypothetical protein EIP91_011872 [Steccherinum ochraceum]|uniref:Glycolipid transfer protein domain-containing protein n=1 Tax=Steccherinum ochraceum TaxID=92696 RepID=A0A4R0RXV1_9APHY|nr:hypothetical protein EIP91_011872 [Steccherinum ochraceum]
MPTYLQSITSFTDVPVTDAGVDTVTFLKASEGVVGIFDLLGAVTFKAVKDDMTGNIAKVRKRYTDFPDKSATLEQLVQNEWTEKARPATEGLMWLLRGLLFTCKALTYSQNNKKAGKQAELVDAFQQAYGETLKQYHNLIVKGLFSAALKWCPTRDDFFRKLIGADSVSAVSEDALANANVEMDEWLAALNAIVTRLQAFYVEGKYEKGPFKG